MSLGRNGYHRRTYDASLGNPYRNYCRTKLDSTKDVGIQSERDEPICTCPKYKRRYFDSHKQIFRYAPVRSFTDIGVGCGRRFGMKNRVRVYLPEIRDRGVGSADLFPDKPRKVNAFAGTSYYETKRTSSKCVGPRLSEYQCSTECVDKKVSPIVVTVSKITSPRNIHIEIKTENKQPNTFFESKATKIEKDTMVPDTKPTKVEERLLKTSGRKTDVPKTITNSIVTEIVVQKGSSVSFVQKIHDLENPSRHKSSKASLEIIEKRLEKEYIKMFENKLSSDSRPIPNFKMPLLRRRFEALRRMGKKNESKKSLSISQVLSQVSVGSRKDVSITSDPPSLEARSFSDANPFGPIQSIGEKAIAKDDKQALPWRNMVEEESDYGVSQGAKGMFKIWGKKFNLEEENYKEQKLLDDNKKVNFIDGDKNLEQADLKPKGKGFSFFKKSKDKTKPFKTKKGVTTGRCEVKDGLVVNLETEKKSASVICKKKRPNLKNHMGTLQKSWIDGFLTNPLENQENLLIRWNNKKFATISSTVFELMDKVYRHNGLVLKSRSELSSTNNLFRSDYKPAVNFFQEIQALMIPSIFYQKVYPTVFKRKRKDNTVKIKLHMDCMPRKYRAIAHRTELILQTINTAGLTSESSDLITIDIPDGFLSTSMCNVRQLKQSSEEISKIVEYESQEGSELHKKLIQINNMACSHNDIKLTISVENGQKVKSKILETTIKAPSFCGETVIDGNNVIGVGIITQSKLRDIDKPFRGFQDDSSGDESIQNIKVIKKCKLAESFLKEYCENYMPLGLDLFLWCASDNQLRQCSEKNSRSTYENKYDGTKSCPNIYQDYQATMSSCAASYCSPCVTDEGADEEPSIHYMSEKYLDRIKSKGNDHELQRILPKDSIEVCIIRRKYAKRNCKAKWNESAMQDPLCTNQDAQKHVTVPLCPPLPDTKVIRPRKTAGILSYKGSSGLFSKKGSKTNSKSSKVSSRSCLKKKPSPLACEIPPSPTGASLKITPKSSRQKNENCSKPNSPKDSKKNSPKASKKNSPKSSKRNSPEISNENIKCPDSCQKINKSKEPKTVRDCPSNEMTKKPNLSCKSIISCSECNPCKDTPPCPQEVSTNQKDKCEFPWPTENNVSNENLLKKCEEKAPCGRISVPCGGESDHKSETENICERCSCCKTMKEQNSKVSFPSTSGDGDETNNCNSKVNRNGKLGLLLTVRPGSAKNNARKEDNLAKSNSNEDLPCRATPSTQEIRENIKFRAQDEDGKTIYERIDYKADHCKKKPNVVTSCILDDVYKNSAVNIVSTPVKTENIDGKNIKKSQTNKKKSNLLEIFLKLRFQKGDKNEHVNLENGGPCADKGKKVNDIYIVRNGSEHTLDKDDSKNQINLKIIIKNSTPKISKEDTSLTQNKMDEVFSKTISEKFHTVSTGYSNYMVDQTVTPSVTEYSIHRATIDLTSSCEKPKTPIKPTDESSTDVVTGLDLCVTSKSVTDISVTDQTSRSRKKYEKEDHNVTVLSVPSKKSKVKNIHDYKEEIKQIYDGASNTHVYITDTDELTDIMDNNTSDDHNSISVKSSVEKNTSEDLTKSELLIEKKDIMKEIFRKAGTLKKTKKKNKIKQLRDMLKILLTSESEPEEMAVTSNELTKNMYAGLTERNIERLNTCTKIDDNFSNFDKNKSQVRFPTKEANSDENGMCHWVRDFDEYKGCICSKMGDRLCCGGGACSCKVKRQVSEAIGCDILTQDVINLLNYKAAEYIDAETQQSKHLHIGSSTAIVNAKDSKRIVQQNAPVNVCLKTYKPPKNFQMIQGNMSYNKSETKSLANDPQIVKNVTDNDEKQINSESTEKIQLEDQPNTVIFETRFVKYKAKDKQKQRKIKVPSGKSATILQSYEIKKAVLEIYAEKIECKGKERLVARLPKFVCDRDSESSSFDKPTQRRSKHEMHAVD